jgi:hypothetical protein
MKHKTLLLTIVFFASVTTLTGEKIIRGKVLAQNNKTAIAYANIGILNSNVGSISNEDGSFSISIPTHYFNDTLLFAALGYQKLNPNKVTVDTMIVRGEKVPYHNWYNFVAGTSFGVSPIKFSLDNYQSYYRNNSFGEWKRAATVLTAQILVSNQPFENRNWK